MVYKQNKKLRPAFRVCVTKKMFLLLSVWIEMQNFYPCIEGQLTKNYISLNLQDVESDAELLEIIRKAERKFDRQQSTKVNSITIRNWCSMSFVMNPDPLLHVYPSQAWPVFRPIFQSALRGG